MIPWINYCFMVLLLIVSCDDKYGVNNVTKSNTIIDIQPFNGISASQTQYVYTELKKVYSLIQVKKIIALPKSAWYPARNRYRADSLIHFLKRQSAKGHITIGLTNEDISTTKNEVADWGVMGLGFRPGNACVASSFRLSKTQTNIQLFKVAIHELGHTQGLPHCPVKSCFMRNAEGKNPTNEEKDFCTSCKPKLIAKGWQFNQ